MRLIPLLLLLALPAAAQVPDQIVVIGDSIAYGTFDPGVEPGRAWPEHVKFETLVDSRPPIRVVNLSQGGASALTWAQQPAIPLYFSRPFVPTIALIALGVNDAIGGRHWVDFGNDIARIALTWHAAGSDRVALLLLPPAPAQNEAQVALRREYNEVQRGLCDSETVCEDGECVDVVCIDISDLPLSFFPPLVPGTGGTVPIHPTALGQSWISVLVRSELRSW